MKQKTILLTLLIFNQIGFCQTYDNLYKMEGVMQNVYYSANAKDRAIKILDNVAKAGIYFEEKFNVHPAYTLLVLSPSDWEKYAHPNAIYGIPHSLPDDILVVASENNEFWKRNLPPVDKLRKALVKRFNDTYEYNNGEISLADFFDLLAVHELGHTFQKTAGMVEQRNWLNELVCNVLLHTFIAEKIPKLMPSLTVFPKITVAGFTPNRLKYTTLEDFETFYNDIAQENPDNYGWYQCRFHTVAGKIYDKGGVAVMEKLWQSLLACKVKLNDQELTSLFKKAHPALDKAIVSWNK